MNKIIKSLELISELIENLPEELTKHEKLTIQHLESLKRNNINVMVLGAFNSGKSTLLNAILGNVYLPIGTRPTSGIAIKIIYGNTYEFKIYRDNGVVDFSNNSELFKKITALDKNHKGSLDINLVELSVESDFLKSPLALYDLPGLFENQNRTRIVKKFLVTSDLVIIFIHAQKAISNSLDKEIENIMAAGIKSFIFVMTHFDKLEALNEKAFDDTKVIGESTWNDFLLRISKYRNLLPKYNIAEKDNGMFVDSLAVYKVNGKEALNAVNKKDTIRLEKSGFINFYSRLNNTVIDLSFYKERYLNRLVNYSEAFRNDVLSCLSPISKLLEDYYNRRMNETKIQETKVNNDKKTIKLVFNKELDFYNYQYLINNFQSSLSNAITNNSFQQWKNNFYFENIMHTNVNVDNCLKEYSSKYEFNPIENNLELPDDPVYYLPERPTFTILEDVYDIFVSSYKTTSFKDYNRVLSDIGDEVALKYLRNISEKSIDKINYSKFYLLQHVKYTAPEIERYVLDHESLFSIYSILLFRINSFRKVLHEKILSLVFVASTNYSNIFIAKIFVIEKTYKFKHLNPRFSNLHNSLNNNYIHSNKNKSKKISYTTSFDLKKYDHKAILPKSTISLIKIFIDFSNGSQLLLMIKIKQLWKIILLNFLKIRFPD